MQLCLPQNLEKDIPSTKVREYLGAIVNSEDMIIEMKPETIEDAIYVIQSIHERRTITLAEARELFGSLTWLSLGIPALSYFTGSVRDKMKVPSGTPPTFEVEMKIILTCKK
jgi:hypothetical protein